MSSSLQFSKYSPAFPFTLVFESGTSEDRLTVTPVVGENGKYLLKYEADMPVPNMPAPVPKMPAPAPARVHDFRSTFNPTQVDIKQYMDDILELILADHIPVKYIHLSTPGYPVTLFNYKMFARSHKEIILRAFMNYMAAA